ncbi:hypothetical protein JL09_g5572, partial [Pichia kudriavzevii]
MTASFSVTTMSSFTKSSAVGSSTPIGSSTSVGLLTSPSIVILPSITNDSSSSQRPIINSQTLSYVSTYQRSSTATFNTDITNSVTKPSTFSTASTLISSRELTGSLISTETSFFTSSSSMPTGGSYFDISSITGKQGAETSYSVVIEKSSSLLPVEVVTTSTLPTRATSPAVSTFVGSFSSKITNSSKEKNTDQSIGTNTSSILKITTHTFTSTGFNTLTPDTTGVTSINSVVSSIDFNGNPSVNDLDGSSFAIFTEFNSISVHSATSGLSSNVTTIKPIDLVRGGETESSTITGHSNSASVVTMTKTVTEITTYYIH